VLGVDEAKIRVIQPALGGAFGGKSEPFDLEFCSGRLSRKAGRP
jgi:4-hydroxybenzoyl-CoA reductase subunit alpha